MPFCILQFLKKATELAREIKYAYGGFSMKLKKTSHRINSYIHIKINQNKGQEKKYLPKQQSSVGRCSDSTELN